MPHFVTVDIDAGFWFFLLSMQHILLLRFLSEKKNLEYIQSIFFEILLTQQNPVAISQPLSLSSVLLAYPFISLNFFIVSRGCSLTVCFLQKSWTLFGCSLWTTFKEIIELIWPFATVVGLPDLDRSFAIARK